MRHEKCYNQVKFYTMHPKCSMVILKKGEHLYGRALVWELSDGERYLDRIYTTNKTEASILFEWGKQQGIKYYYTLRYDNPMSREPKQHDVLLVETNILNWPMSADDRIQWPWLDTFREISSDGKYLVSMASSSLYTSDMSIEKLILRYGHKVIPCTNNGPLRDWIREYRSDIRKNLEATKVRIKIHNIYDPYDNYADLEDVAFCSEYGAFFLKSHLTPNGKPKSVTQIRTEMAEQRAKEATTSMKEKVQTPNVTYI